MKDEKKELTEEERAKVQKVREILARELEDTDLEDISGGFTDVNFGCIEGVH